MTTLACFGGVLQKRLPTIGSSHPCHTAVPHSSLLHPNRNSVDDVVWKELRGAHRGCTAPLLQRAPQLNTMRHSPHHVRIFPGQRNWCTAELRVRESRFPLNTLK
jgi:hypothetical protein